MMGTCHTVIIVNNELLGDIITIWAPYFLAFKLKIPFMDFLFMLRSFIIYLFIIF